MIIQRSREGVKHLPHPGASKSCRCISTLATGSRSNNYKTCRRRLGSSCRRATSQTLVQFQLPSSTTFACTPAPQKRSRNVRGGACPASLFIVAPCDKSTNAANCGSGDVSPHSKIRLVGQLRAVVLQRGEGRMPRQSEFGYFGYTQALDEEHPGGGEEHQNRAQGQRLPVVHPAGAREEAVNRHRQGRIFRAG